MAQAVHAAAWVHRAALLQACEAIEADILGNMRLAFCGIVPSVAGLHTAPLEDADGKLPQRPHAVANFFKSHVDHTYYNPKPYKYILTHTREISKPSLFVKDLVHVARSYES